jgi:muskelin
MQSYGGPPLVFDHQMVMDSDAQMLYVFGGRVLDGDWTSTKYSGLYSYNVRTGKWKMLQ